ncbi:unnamed protein product [marine sediment metagenome]|uniref:Tsp45I type II restriction enzyme n=1 Tax=marine sediment metagenome TaxID=412755 RepID=X1LZY5_9ZZZZ
MNEWVRKSIETANVHGYLDRLHEVYPVTWQAAREIPPEIKEEFWDAYSHKNNLRLMRSLLSLDKFPIKDPYVAFLRKRDFFLEYNPQTVKRIVEHLYSMGFELIVKGIEEPKEFNRQIGPLFKRWVPTLGYPFLAELEFGQYEGIAFLQGSNGELMNYANTALGCNLNKGPDLLVKAGKHYVLGEAKFLTDYGGHQNAQFADALNLLRGKEGNAIRIAILDGVVWIKDSTKMYRTVCQLEQVALSSLLLKDFLEELHEKE